MEIDSPNFSMLKITGMRMKKSGNETELNLLNTSASCSWKSAFRKSCHLHLSD